MLGGQDDVEPGDEAAVAEPSAAAADDRLLERDGVTPVAQREPGVVDGPDRLAEDDEVRERRGGERPACAAPERVRARLGEDAVDRDLAAEKRD